MELTQRLDLAGRVSFAGAVGATDLPGYYAAADIFVHPNRSHEGDFEGFGIVFLEAAGAGLPTIGGRSGGVPEAIDEHATGLLVGGEDVSELAAAISALSASSGLRRQMGEAGRQRVGREFTWERAAAQVASIHAQVAAVA
jgi:phosphatidylinositol alpha-1,6-mannosyltransferase